MYTLILILIRYRHLFKGQQKNSLLVPLNLKEQIKLISNLCLLFKKKFNTTIQLLKRFSNWFARSA